MGLLTGWKRWLRNTAVYHAAGPVVLYLKNKWFDVKHGVKTAETVPMSRLRLHGPHAREGVIYATLTDGALWASFNRIAIPYAEYSFVDFGSGKGKAILVASQLSFRKVIGVEYSEELIGVARKNLETCRGLERKCGGIELLNMDAADFEIPSGPLVLYFYNPFYETVMQKVVSNIRRSLIEDPRPAYVIYMNPECGRLFESSPEFREVERGDWHAIYASNL